MDEPENINLIYQFNNKSRSTGFYILYILSGVVFLLASCILIFTNRDILLVVTIIVAIIYFILLHRIKPSYIEVLVTDHELQVNYYSVAAALKSYRSILIEIDHFKGFIIKKSTLGLSRQLILSVESKKGLADYPPVSISILKKSEIDQISTVLSKITQP